MSESRTILTYHNLTVEVETTPGEELLEHMHGTIMGQPGGFRYQHTNLVDRLNAPGENYFLYLRKDSKMLGSVGFCGKPSETLGVRFDTWLIRYFSIKAPMRTVPNKRKENSVLKDEKKKSSVLGRFFQPVCSDPSIMREGDQEPETPAIIYGTIEQKNLRSMNFSAQMGLETVGIMAGFTFSRMRPRKSGRVEQLPGNAEKSMLALLKEFYREYTLFFQGPLFKDNGYYVIQEAGRVIAGIQVYPVTWSVVGFGSGIVNRAIRTLTISSWVRKRFNTSEVKLLAMDGIYCEKGHESALYELMEGVLERTNNYIAMLMMDTESDLYGIYNRTQKLGFLHRVLGTVKADIRVRFINLPEEIRQHFIDHPTYIPTYDNT